jgi:hypothetical protein
VFCIDLQTVLGSTKPTEEQLALWLNPKMEGELTKEGDHRHN